MTKKINDSSKGFDSLANNFVIVIKLKNIDGFCTVLKMRRMEIY